MLNSARNRFTAARRSTSGIFRLSTAAAALSCNCAPNRTIRTTMITMLTIGPAMAMRNAFELGHAADRQQGHVRRWYVESARRENVAELMQQHAQKQKNHEDEAVPGGRGSPRRVARGENPREKQQEGEVYANDGSRDLADIQ